MNLLVRFGSALAMAGYGVFLFFLIGLAGWYGESGQSAPVSAWLFFAVLPFVYLAFCFVTSFANFRGRWVFYLGIVVHLSILPLLVISFLAAETAIIGVLGLIMSGAWFVMYSNRTSGREAGLVGG